MVFDFEGRPMCRCPAREPLRKRMTSAITLGGLRECDSFAVPLSAQSSISEFDLSTCRSRLRCFGMLNASGLIVLVSSVAVSLTAFAEHPCATCHPQQVENYLRTGMGRSLTRAALQPPGRFVHRASGSTVVITVNSSTMRQRIERNGLSADHPVAYVIGSGHKAFGYLIDLRDHLYQSPLTYYSERHVWDVAPGFEENGDLDFNRPATLECLLCHSGQPRPVDNT